MELRAPLREDAAAIVEVGRRFGVRDETVQDLEIWFDMPSMDMERNARVVVENGSVVGYADVGDRAGDGRVLWLDLRAQAEGMTVLLDFLDARVGELAADDAKVKAWSPEENSAWRALLESRGYEFDRFSRQMRISLGEDLLEPEWPEGISVRTYRRSEDERAVYEAHQESFSAERDFQPDPFDEWQQWSYRDPFDPELWFLAEDGDEIAGIALCRGERGGDEMVGWVNILAVRKPWRRRGLGKALLRHAFRELRRKGKEAAGLGVDGDNEEALALYERAGMTTDRGFVWYERGA